MTSIAHAARITPSPRQIAWQETEFYAFIHFNMNVYTDREWGTGSEDPALFNPVEFDANQWVQVVQSAGMRGLILTAKHHDGFCLWPSATTDYTVAASPWRDGKGDLVGDVAAACRAAGLKFGVYLSPWDRHEPTYGDSPAYNAYFLAQLRELLSNYGDVFSVWFDGACGEGPNGKVQVYDWAAYYALVRELQPNAAISICGPDVRWCGNEAGHTRPSEWSVVPATLRDAEKVHAISQQEDDPSFATRVRSDDDDLGSRQKIAGVAPLVWYPAEVNTSIRPGWFYHTDQDDAVKSLSELLDVYFGAVGGNANFLLNFPPDARGLIHEIDAQRAAELGTILRETFATNLAGTANVQADSARGNHPAAHVLDGDKRTYWAAAADRTTASLELTLPKAQRFNVVLLQEQIRVGQRVERCRVSIWNDETWQPIAETTVIGYKRLLRVPTVQASRIRVEILESRAAPTLSTVGLYYHPHFDHIPSDPVG